MIRLEPLEDGDFETIARWNADKPRDFLAQWAGPQYEYPLTAAYLVREHAGHNAPGADTFIYRVMLGQDMIGAVQLLRIDRQAGAAVVGRFLIGGEGDRSRGYGRQALREIVTLAFDAFGLKTVSLAVFDFNRGAIRCYESVGFETYEFAPDAYQSATGPWGLYRMKLTPERLKAAAER